MRADAKIAYAVHIGRLIAGHHEERSIDAEVGAILSAEKDTQIAYLAQVADALVKANGG